MASVVDRGACVIAGPANTEWSRRANPSVRSCRRGARLIRSVSRTVTLYTVTDQNKASQLAREGFDLWQAGKLDDSVAKYQQAFVLADPDHYALADYHGELAAVLAILGRDAAALEQY